MKNKRLMAFFGHHKCATTWINIIIHQASQRLGLKFVNVHTAEMFDGHLDRFVDKRGIDFLAYTNAEIAYVKDLDNFIGFHVIRDPRDIVVSAYFSHLHSHALYDWDYEQPDIMEIRMEDLILSPSETIISAFSHLGLVDENPGLMSLATFYGIGPLNRIYTKLGVDLFPHRTLGRIPLQSLSRIIHDQRFSRKAKGRKPGEENARSHYRKGISGDWINHFQPEHCEYFKKKYNDLLLKLGYEESPDWNLPAETE